MKKIVYFIATGICYVMFISYATGPANHAQWDCTGAETGLGNFAGCQNGCHAPTATAGIGLTIELDSMGTPVTNYKGGTNYTIKLTGTNNTNNSLPKFGFQIGAIVGSSAQDTPTNAGTWITPTPPNPNYFFSDSTHYMAPQATYYSVGVIENSRSLTATTGNGGTGTTYSRTFSWKAPVTGTGPVSFWAVLNAVNNNGGSDAGDLWDTTHIVINEWGYVAPVPTPTTIPTPTTTPTPTATSTPTTTPTPTVTGVPSYESISAFINVFPIPASTELNVIYSLKEDSDVALTLIDTKGEVIADLLNEKQSAGLQVINTILPTNLSEGIYMLRVTINEKQFMKKIVVKY